MGTVILAEGRESTDGSKKAMRRKEWLYPLSQEGGGLLQPPPLRIFPRAVFAFSLRLPVGQFTYPLSKYPCFYEKKIQKFLP